MNIRQIFLLLLFLPVSSSLLAETKDSITKIEIGNLSFADGQLHIHFQLGKFVAGTGNEKVDVLRRSYSLSAEVAKAYRAMINEVGILRISSHKPNCIDCKPFRIRYTLRETQHEIVAFLHNMTAEDRETLARYEKLTEKLINVSSWEKKFHDELPDGNYVAVGHMVTGKTYRKKNGQFAEVELPLYIRDGKVISVDEFEQLGVDGKRYELTKLDDPGATAIYGNAGRFGVVLIREVKEEAPLP
ncbi:hypothetical protein [Sphingobacterium bambusae]|uniref:DUF3108 domain-containing protein n=1 Tax=Sphingobacterium bambusae TaxID=662858 RepID=A0ABW6BLM6_9SPHI|nr:hypothetical protein [Sphingobacterium bambusae]WPL50925.1 hypothetical protein SCB77_10740 [Sphingobacterium bambusae]